MEVIMLDMRKRRPVWVEIDLDALDSNMREIRRIVAPGTLVTAVVKADAYGTGAAIVSKELLDNGADRLAVAVLDEAVELRQAGITAKILILGPTSGSRAEELINFGIDAPIFHYEDAVAFSHEAVRQNKPVSLHIAIDSGMGRIGYSPTEENIQEIIKISKLPNVILEGIFTHFAVADTEDKTFTREQYKKFKSVCDRLQEEHVPIHLQHCCNSAAILDLPEYHNQMVRAGIIMYGLAPSAEVDITRFNLKKVISLKCRVDHIKTIEKGSSVSYGRKFIATGPTRIASLPVGYADGYTRMLSDKTNVLVHGKRAKQVGSICMDQCMIDVTHIPDVKTGDEVVLFGEQKGTELPVEELANILSTINYEIICMIARRVPRVYTRSGTIYSCREYLQD
jgi:alanine racemase